MAEHIRTALQAGVPLGLTLVVLGIGVAIAIW
jgi:hypothetical protein